MLQIHETSIHRAFAAFVALKEEIFPCFNLRPDDLMTATWLQQF